MTRVFFHGPARSLTSGGRLGLGFFYVPHIKTLVPSPVQASWCGGSGSPLPGLCPLALGCPVPAAGGGRSAPPAPGARQPLAGPECPLQSAGMGAGRPGGRSPAALPAPGREWEMFAGLGAGGGLSPPAWVQAGNGALPAEARPLLSVLVCIGTNGASCVSLADQGSKVPQKFVRHRVCPTQRTAGVIFTSAEWQQMLSNVAFECMWHLGHGF